jgi:cytochrome c5
VASPGQAVLFNLESKIMKTSKFLPFIIVIALAACGQKTSTTETASAPVAAVSAPPAAAVPPAASAAPVAPSAPAVAVASAADLAKGEKVYGATCLACHGAGVMGAPKFADKAAWQPRIAKGSATLYTSAMDGLKMMPPKGGNMMLKDDEVKAAVDYMVSKAM